MVVHNIRPITPRELHDIGVYLNDGRTYGWQGKLAVLLKKNNHTSISKWTKDNHYCRLKMGIDRISGEDIQHMRLLVRLKQKGLLQEFLIAAQSNFYSEQQEQAQKPVREQIAEALKDDEKSEEPRKASGRWDHKKIGVGDS